MEKELNIFSKSTQLSFLYFLYNKDAVINTTEFARKMGFTKMTASRALNDLYGAKLVTCEIGGKTGRSKEYERIPDPEYFERGRAHIKTPVKRVVYVQKLPEDTLIAGLDALAELSMINPPGHPVRAIGQNQFNKQYIEIIRNKDLIKDTKPVELQIWGYNPKQFSDKQHLDILSLYASLREEKDDRIEQALQEVLRGKPWYTD